MENESGKSSELGNETLDFSDETDDSTCSVSDLPLFPEWSEPKDDAAFADLYTSVRRPDFVTQTPHRRQIHKS